MKDENLSDWIAANREKMVQDIVSLVNIQSISIKGNIPGEPFGPGCRHALDAALKLAERKGLQVKNAEGYYGLACLEGEKKSSIGIFNHMDVVPEGEGWRYPPYQATVRDGLIIGRGAADNKGPAIAMQYVLRYLMDTGFRPHHTIQLYYGCSEEHGMADLDVFRKQELMPRFSFTPDAAFPVCSGEKGILQADAWAPLQSGILVDFSAGIASNAVPASACAVLQAEPTMLKDMLAGIPGCRIEALDSSTVKITVSGIAAHAAFPEGSDSAEVRLATILRQLPFMDKPTRHLLDGICALFGDYYGAGIGCPWKDEISGRLTHVGGMLRTENGTLHQNINIRYNITADREKLQKNLRDALQKNGFSRAELQDDPPCYLPAEHPQVRTLAEIANKHLGTALPPYTMGGGTYARKLENAVGFGPGMPDKKQRFGPARGGAHQTDEYVEIEALEKAIPIYVEAIRCLDAQLD